MWCKIPCSVQHVWRAMSPSVLLCENSYEYSAPNAQCSGRIKRAKTVGATKTNISFPVQSVSLCQRVRMPSMWLKFLCFIEPGPLCHLTSTCHTDRKTISTGTQLNIPTDKSLHTMSGWRAGPDFKVVSVKVRSSQTCSVWVWGRWCSSHTNLEHCNVTQQPFC